MSAFFLASGLYSAGGVVTHVVGDRQTCGHNAVSSLCLFTSLTLRELFLVNGDAFTIKLPENLTPGDYLIRHEIIALHLAVTKGGAEFYPSCTQVRVGGSGSGQPNQTVTFPGAYSDTDPGIFDPTVFDSDDNYVFPGPPISNLAGTLVGTTDPITGSASFPSGSATATTTGGASTKGASATATAGSTGSTAVSSSSTKSQCKLKKRVAVDAVIRPRHLSRVMARLLHSQGLSS